MASERRRQATSGIWSQSPSLPSGLRRDRQGPSAERRPAHPEVNLRFLFRSQLGASKWHSFRPINFATSHATPGPISSAKPSSVKRSEEHTSELQSLMRISYAVFCLKKKNINS